MKFCLNITDFLSINYRLKVGNTWEQCNNPEVVRENDYVTENPQDIRDLLKANWRMTINDKLYVANPDEEESNIIRENRILNYQSYGFFEELPKSPDKAQFDLVIGTINTHFRLLIKTDGNFYAVHKDSISIIDPEIVFIYSYDMIEEAENNKLENTSNLLFQIGLGNWARFLELKELHSEIDYTEKTGHERNLENATKSAKKKKWWNLP